MYENALCEPIVLKDAIHGPPHQRRRLCHPPPIARCCRAGVCRKRRFPHLAQRHCPGCRGQPGAIYWHFKNKADLFNAMLERITLPMEEALQKSGQVSGQDGLRELVAAILDALRKIASDKRTRQVFEVATYKVEYVDELLAIKARQIKSHADVVCQMHHALQDACSRRNLPLASPMAMSHGLHALVVGLIHSWLLAPEVFDLVKTAEVSIQIYLAGLGLGLAST
jgi:TetR/AcrR family acrAB operon transcriptional repressor